MKLKLEVKETERTYTVETNLFVLVAWERKFKRKVSDLANGIGMEDLAFMAYTCCQQINHSVPAVFDDYVKRLISIEVLDEENANPTEEAVTSES
jgi:hypothetical protein